MYLSIEFESFYLFVIYIYLGEGYAAVSVVDGLRSEEEEPRGSCTTELEETDMGFPSSCNIILPSISVNSFLNSSSLTIFASSAFIILNTSPITLSICIYNNQTITKFTYPLLKHQNITPSDLKYLSIRINHGPN
ncbi:hypothetical protein Ahy_A03g016239 isoform F [Arachis hypogaea]|uniref:Uncharacterized protein n=1 Tax=Arachis hypogaea TaxID=3818 RepID=A0A445E2U7_ARAHY|nr:hypothetical protein Ahy_A03g016239 isoform F [Arachis hypogaea]